MPWRLCTLAVLLISCCAIARKASAIDVTIDYTYDDSNFFGSGNPDGQAAGVRARQALEAAADYFSEILDDTFNGFTIPSRVDSSVQDGYFEWFITFGHPSNGSSVKLTDATQANDEYRIYAGAEAIGGTTLGVGGPGGWGFGSVPDQSVLYTNSEINLINARTSEFQTNVIQRGENTGFAAWGGSISFDNDGSTNWHYDHTVQPSGNTNDFFSVALHELAHALGLGTSSEWSDLIVAGTFRGSQAQAANGGTFPPASGGHWAAGTTSTIFGTSTTQEAALDPNITRGTRKLFTTLDAAAMEDIGWTVVPPAGLIGDYNADNLVNATDYAIWRDSLGSGSVIGNYGEWRTNFGQSLGAVSSVQISTPEPSSALLASLACLVGYAARRRSRAAVG